MISIVVDIEYGKAFRNGRLFDCPKWTLQNIYLKFTLVR